MKAIFVFTVLCILVVVTPSKECPNTEAQLFSISNPKSSSLFTRIDLNNGTAKDIAEIKDMIPLEHAATMDIGANTIYSIGKRDNRYFLNSVDIELGNTSSVRIAFPITSLKVTNENLFGVVQLPDSYIISRIDPRNGNIYRLQVIANSDVKSGMASAIDTFAHKYHTLFSGKTNSILLTYDITDDKASKVVLPTGYIFNSLEINPAGSHLLTLASNTVNNTIGIYEVDTSTGQLTEKVSFTDFKSAVIGVSALCVPCACPTQIYFAPVKTADGLALELLDITGKSILSSFKLNSSPLAFALIP